jgi:hypothetical protein
MSEALNHHSYQSPAQFSEIASQNCLARRLQLEQVNQQLPEMRSGKFCRQKIELQFNSNLKKKICVGSVNLWVVPSAYLKQQRFQSLTPLVRLIEITTLTAEDLSRQPFVVYVESFHIKPLLRDHGLGTLMFEAFFDWLKQLPFKRSLLINTSNPVKLDKSCHGSMSINQAKQRLQEWLQRFEFENIDNNANHLMLYKPQKEQTGRIG